MTLNASQFLTISKRVIRDKVPARGYVNVFGIHFDTTKIANFPIKRK
jgi:hypothetical protein